MSLNHNELARKASNTHEFDEDCICTKCGFDGAEWWHWKHHTYEGKASDAKQPLCDNSYIRR